MTPDWRPKGQGVSLSGVRPCEVLAESIGESLNGETDGMRDESHQAMSNAVDANRPYIGTEGLQLAE